MEFTIQVKGLNVLCTINFNNKYKVNNYDLCVNEGRSIDVQDSNRRTFATYHNIPDIRQGQETKFDITYSCLILEVEDTVG